MPNRYREWRDAYIRIGYELQNRDGKESACKYLQETPFIIVMHESKWSKGEDLYVRKEERDNKGTES